MPWLMATFTRNDEGYVVRKVFSTKSATPTFTTLSVTSLRLAMLKFLEEMDPLEFSIVESPEREGKKKELCVYLECSS